MQAHSWPQLATRHWRPLAKIGEHVIIRISGVTGRDFKA